MTVVQGVRTVSLQFQKIITKANEKADEWKLLQSETYIFKFSFFFSFLPHLMHLYMGTVSCTKHIETVMGDFTL